MAHSKYRSAFWFVGGLLLGTTACLAMLWISGASVVGPEQQLRQSRELAELRSENLELTEELLQPRMLPDEVFSTDDLPYAEGSDAGAEVALARDRAVTEGKFLMVTFGANWCLDCRNLHRILKNSELSTYTRDLFQFVNVNVGKFNQNRDVAEALGVDLARGIPVAIFFDPGGQVIGTTNGGQLEPARHYTSKQILKFIRDVAERSHIAAPDSIY